MSSLLEGWIKENGVSKLMNHPLLSSSSNHTILQIVCIENKVALLYG